MSRAPDTLLTRLLVLYWHDGVTQGKAAHLLGIRKQEFAEFADLKLGERALQRVADEYLARAFHRQFPECNVPLCLQRRYAKPMSDAARAFDKRAKASDVEMVTPPNPDLREIVPRQRRPDAEVARYLKANPVPLWKRFKEPERKPELELDFTQ